MLPIPNRRPCILCGKPLRKAHILFYCPIVKKYLENFKYKGFTMDLTKWNERDIFFIPFRQIYHETVRINWNELRIKYTIAHHMWVLFTSMQFGERSPSNVFQSFQANLTNFLNEYLSIQDYIKNGNRKKEGKIVDNKFISHNKFTEQNIKISNTDYCLLIKNYKLHYVRKTNIHQ